MGLLSVEPVNGTERRGEAVDARPLNEVAGLFGLGVESCVCDALGRVTVLVAGHDAELALDCDPALVSHSDDLAGDANVFLILAQRAVDHARIKADLEALSDVVDVFAVVYMNDERGARAFCELDDGGSDLLDWGVWLVDLGVLQDDWLPGLFANLDGGGESFEERGVDGGKPYIIFFGTGESIGK